MDWGKFWQDYGASLFTAAGVILGIVATTVVSILRNRFEAGERQKERLDRQRELATALDVQLMKADIAKVMQTIDNSLKTINFVDDLRLQRALGKISEDEMIRQMQFATFDDTGKLHVLGELDIVSRKLAHTFGEKFYTEWKKYDEVNLEYLKYIKLRESYAGQEKIPDKDGVLYEKLISSAASLHSMLRNMLVTMRRNQIPEPSENKNWLQQLLDIFGL